MPARSADAAITPGSTGEARYDQTPGANVSLNGRSPDGVNSVTILVKPQEITQLPPGSFRAPPQQLELGARGSLIDSTSVAVRAVVSSVKRSARGGRPRRVPLS